MPLLDGRTAVITGAAQGIGFAIAQRVVCETPRRVLGDLDPAATEAAAKALGGGDVAVGVRCAVTDGDQIDALLATAIDTFGVLDIMVNNAGITRDATMRTMTEDQFDQVINVHLKDPWQGTRKAAEIMRERKSGTIVNMSSISGKTGAELLGRQSGNRRVYEGSGPRKRTTTYG